MVKVRIVTGPEAEENRKQLRRFRENVDLLEREWKHLRTAHVDEWAIAYGGDTIVFVAEMGDIHAAIPEEHKSTAEVRYVTADDSDWIL